MYDGKTKEYWGLRTFQHISCHFCFTWLLKLVGLQNFSLNTLNKYQPRPQGLSSERPWERGWINIIYIPHLPFIETDWLNWRQITQLKRHGFCHRAVGILSRIHYIRVIISWFTLKDFIDFLLPPSYSTNVSSKKQKKKTFQFSQELKRSSLRLILTLWLSECRGYVFF